MKTQIKLYTDGACAGNPGPGGTGFVVIGDDQVLLKGRNGYRRTTNNRMEILAVAEALQALKGYLDGKGQRETDVKVTVFSDSQLVVNTMTQGWSKKTNLDMWEKLDEAMSLFSGITFVKVKGHSTDRWNNMADEMAVTASKAPKGIDTKYEDICKEDDGRHAVRTPSLFEPIIHPEPVKVDTITLKGCRTKNERSIEILLTNGTTLRILPLYEGFQIVDCTAQEARTVNDIAFHFNKWLHGSKMF